MKQKNTTRKTQKTKKKTKKMSRGGAYSSLAREEGEVEGAVMLEEEEESCEHHHGGQLNSNSTGGRAVGPYRMCIVWCPIPVLTYAPRLGFF